MYEAKIIKDSIANGNRLTTMQITHPRIIHSEFMTHRMFCRNASSSRAIPFKKMVEQVETDPFIPIYWGKNQSGMQANEEIEYPGVASYNWQWAAKAAIKYATELNDLGVHKQICNRLLEPFSWITVCVTGDEAAYSNYFALRCHKDAQPEIRKQAEMARDCHLSSTPKEIYPGEWHLPYINDEEIASIDKFELSIYQLRDKLIKVSVGRCARISYLTQEGIRDWKKDVELHDRLISSKPMHASPMEHVQQAVSPGGFNLGMYKGWRSYRSMLRGEYTIDYFKRLKEG